jgi:hypothetical protein
VSGEVTLVDGAGGATSKLVRVAARLFSEPGFAPAALVGGLAVTIRLAAVHRATNDVDVVSGGDAPRDAALQYLAEGADGARRIEVEGVKVDVMPTYPIDTASLPDDDVDRLFVIGHRWALESASPTTVEVVTPVAEVVESASLKVATIPALVACKFHAISGRRGAGAAKRESDALDLVRLVGEVVRAPEHAVAFADAPLDLSQLVRTQIDRWFVDNALRTSRLARLGGLDVEPADIEALGTLWRSAVAPGA